MHAFVLSSTWVTILSIALPQSGASSAEARIVGGSAVGVGEFPWVVLIRYFDLPFCGGTILNENYVLTAAHCVRFFSGRYKIIAGEHSLNKDEGKEQIRGILDVKVHPGFDVLNLQNDLALIRVNESFVFDDYVQPGVLANASFLPEAKLVAVGWGLEREGDTSLAEELRQVGIRLLPQGVCKKHLSSVKGIAYNSGVFCGGGVSGKGTCFGDSGGPVHSGETVFGISTATAVCGRESSPAVYTRVQHFESWIASCLS